MIVLIMFTIVMVSALSDVFGATDTDEVSG